MTNPKYFLKPCHGNWAGIPNNHIYIVSLDWNEQRKVGYVLPSDISQVFESLEHEVSDSHSSCGICFNAWFRKGHTGVMSMHTIDSVKFIPALLEGQFFFLMPCHGYPNVGIPQGHVYKVELDRQFVGYLPVRQLLNTRDFMKNFRMSSSSSGCGICLPYDQANGDVKKVERRLIKTQEDLKDLTDRLD